MKFTCLQESLGEALGIVAPIASKNATLPILQNLLLKTEEGGLTISSTNLEIGVVSFVRGKLEEEGEITAQASLLSNFVNLLDEEHIQLSTEGAKILVSSGKQKTNIQGMDAADFPVLPKTEEGVSLCVDRKVLCDAISSVSFCVVQNDIRPEIGGMLFNIENKTLTLVGTDSYRLAERSVPINEDIQFKAIIPSKTIQEIQRILAASTGGSFEVKLVFSENQLCCTIGSTQLISRLIEGKYPSYKDIIPQKTETQCVINRDRFLRAIKRSSLFCSSGINDINIRFRLPKENNENGGLEMSSQNTQLGTHEEIIDAVITGKENSSVFNWRYVADGLQHIQAPEIIFEVVDASSPGIIRPAEEGKRDYLCLVMPIRQ